MSSIVRPEFGDSLPALIGPRWRALGPIPRALGIAAVVLVALGVLYALLGGGSSKRSVEVAAPVAFRLEYDGDSLVQRLALGRESLRLETPTSVVTKRSFIVQPLLLPSYEGSIGGFLPLQAERLFQQMKAVEPGLIRTAEGPVLLNDQPGYEIFYQLRRGSQTLYRQRVLLFPAARGARAGVDITLSALSSGGLLSPAAPAKQPPLREPFESLVVGS